MRLETLDKLTQAIRATENAEKPRVPGAPETGEIPYDRPLDMERVDRATRDGASRAGIRPEELERSVEEANAIADSFPHRSVLFELAREDDHIVVLIIDRNSGQTLRQVPPPEFLSFLSRVQAMMGLFFDTIV